jgi:thiamine transporter
MLTEKLQSLLGTIGGQIAIVAIIALLLFAIMKISGKGNQSTKVLVTTSILIALSFVLNKISIVRMPQGGSITPFSMLTLSLVGYLYGTRQGIMAGVAVGLLDLLLGGYVVHPIQLLLDYPLGFAALGLSGLFRDKKNGLITGYIAGVIGRYICVVISGIVFWGEFAPENFNALSWSLYYNITYIGAEAVITILILSVPSIKNLLIRLKQIA